MSIAPRLLEAFLDADIQGGSTQWYPYSHNNGFDYHGNLLPQIDKWPKDSITQTVKERNKAMMAYEIDATDNGHACNYPAVPNFFTASLPLPSSDKADTGLAGAAKLQTDAHHAQDAV